MEYLNKYKAPFELPGYTAGNWPTSLIGPAPGEVMSRIVGPEKITIASDESFKNVNETSCRLVKMGISGTVFGYIAKKPPCFNFDSNFFNAVTMEQFGPFFPGVAHYSYSEKTPSGIELLFPSSGRDWNGVLWVIVPGTVYYPPLQLMPRKKGSFNRFMMRDFFSGYLVDSGSAVAWIRRSSVNRNEKAIPEEYAVLDDGTRVGGPGKVGVSFAYNADLIRDFTVIAKNCLVHELSKEPGTTLFFGHSSGGSIGRIFNYIPGINVDHQQQRLFDGIFISDTAGGRGEPNWFVEAEVDKDGVTYLKPSSKDSLYFEEKEKSKMVPVIEMAHMAYAGPRTVTVPRVYKRFPTNYLQLKRDNMRQIIERGLSDIWRYYEIKDISHYDGSNLFDSWPEMASKTVDAGGVYTAMLEALVEWVTEGKQPPSNRTDAHDLKAIDTSAKPSIELPDSACPLGVFVEYMQDPGNKVLKSVTSFVPYLTEPRPQINADTMPESEWPDNYRAEWLEPLNAYGYLVDMTGSGTRMTKPTIEQAWKMRYRQGCSTGILKPYDSLTRAYYVLSVMKVAMDLYQDRLLTGEAVKWYLERAINDNIGV